MPPLDFMDEEAADKKILKETDYFSDLSTLRKLLMDDLAKDPTY